MTEYFATLRRTGVVVLLVVTGFVILELALQLRSHVRYGQSIFNALSGETMYEQDARTGLKLLRPNRRFEGSQATIVSNSLGLRGPEVEQVRPDAGIRLAVLGASSVMGAYARSNEVTLSELLREELTGKLDTRKIEVINAGIAGATLRDQRETLEKILAGLKPDLVVLYSGFNDFARYCRRPKTRDAEGWRLPRIELPRFLLTVDLLLKNTESLRRTMIERSDYVDPDSIDYSVYRSDLADLVNAARTLKIRLVLATNARAYRRDQTHADQQKLSHTARYFNHCFSLEGLHEIYDRHNQMISELAVAHGLPLVPLAELIPGGDRYFSDSSHFSELGERLAARELAKFMLSNRLLTDEVTR